MLKLIYQKNWHIQLCWQKIFQLLPMKCGDMWPNWVEFEVFFSKKDKTFSFKGL